MTTLKQPALRNPKWVIGLWLLQLVIPALLIFLCTDRLIRQEAQGVRALTVLAAALVWCAFCCWSLAQGKLRRWIVGHPALLIALCIPTALGLIATEMYCRCLLTRSWESLASPSLSRMAYSSELGWKLIPGEDGVGEHGWRGAYRTSEKPKGCFRIVCLGDAATYGEGCPWNDAWPQQLETFLNADGNWVAVHGAAQVINLGVPGYGTDQQLLALKRYGLSFHPDAMVLHLRVEDFQKVSSERAWQMPDGVTRYKPFFAVEAGKLVLKCDFAPSPRHPSGKVYEPGERPSLGMSSALLYRFGAFLDKPHDRRLWPIDTNCQTEYAKARPLLWALVREMARAAHEADSIFLLTLSPTLMDTPTDEAGWRDGSFLKEYEADAEAAGVSAINCVPEYFAEGGHYRFRGADTSQLSRHGNAFVAQHTMRWLKEHAPARQYPAR